MRKLKGHDFIPPIVIRLCNYVSRKYIQFILGKRLRHAPFDKLPKNLDVRWVLDIGANVGDVAENALNSYRGCNVICVEPVEETWKELKKRLCKYGSRVSIHKFALSDKAGTGEINITTSHGANSIESQAQLHKECNPQVREIGKEKIILMTLDEFSKSLPCWFVDVMKVDVEGHELKLLEGGISFISNRVKYIIIEISLMRDQSVNGQAIFGIFSTMESAGFVFQNAFDFHYTENGSLLVQMDCIFRNTRLVS